MSIQLDRVLNIFARLLAVNAIGWQILAIALRTLQTAAQQRFVNVPGLLLLLVVVLSSAIREQIGSEQKGKSKNKTYARANGQTVKIWLTVKAANAKLELQKVDFNVARSLNFVKCSSAASSSAIFALMLQLLF